MDLESVTSVALVRMIMCWWCPDWRVLYMFPIDVSTVWNIEATSSLPLTLPRERPGFIKTIVCVYMWTVRGNLGSDVTSWFMYIPVPSVIYSNTPFHTFFLCVKGNQMANLHVTYVCVCMCFQVYGSSYLAQIIDIFCQIKSIIAVMREHVTVQHV